MINAIAHLCISVNDLRTMEDFYVQKLGLSKAFDDIDENGRLNSIYLRVGNRAFIEMFGDRAAGDGKGQAYCHICLEVDDMAKTVAEIRARGAEVSEPKLGKDNSWQAWISDPDGNNIELHSYTKESRQTPHL